MIEALQADSPYKVLKTCKFERPVTRNDVITKNNGNNGKMRTSTELNEIYIVGKALMRGIQKCNFY